MTHGTKKLDKKPVMIYFRSPNNDVTKGDSTVVADYNDILPVHVVVCDGWNQLDQMLLDDPNLIAINSNVFTNTDAATIKETIAMLQTKLKLSRLCIPIALVIENNTVRSVVLEAKRLGLQGLIPYHGDWDQADIMAGLAAFSDRKTHWPQHIINQLPDPKGKDLVVYLRQNWQTYLTPEINAKVIDNPNNTWQVEWCSEWAEVSQKLEKLPQLLVFHAGMLDTAEASITQFVDMIETLVKVTVPGHNISVALAVDRDTPYSVIKALQKTTACGIVPAAGTWGVADTCIALGTMTMGRQYWPAHIITQIKEHSRTKKTPSVTIHITGRQREVLNLICNRGLSNKKIAQMLNITESTVKVHISAILRSYGVRNRTQLVLAARESLTA
jgi:DNA-binding NarL/FixJ family response regulator